MKALLLAGLLLGGTMSNEGWRFNDLSIVTSCTWERNAKGEVVWIFDGCDPEIRRRLLEGEYQEPGVWTVIEPRP